MTSQNQTTTGKPATHDPSSFNHRLYAGVCWVGIWLKDKIKVLDLIVPNFTKHFSERHQFLICRSTDGHGQEVH